MSSVDFKAEVKLPKDAFYLVSYPRSGNTWLFYSLSMLFKAVRAEARSQFDRYPYLYGEVGTDSFYLRAEDEVDMSRPLIIKSHETRDVYNRLYPKAKCVYIYRDGRDALLSCYFFSKAFSVKEETIFERVGKEQVLTVKTLKEVNFDAKEFAEFLRIHAVEWANHVETWLKADGVLTLSYEDLHYDFVGELMEIIAYLGIAPAVSVADVKKEYVDDFRQLFSGDSRQFFLKGTVGDWQNHFTQEHSRIFFELVGDLLIKLGYEQRNVI